ncbi:type VI secretion system lipoprotein TssJ [Pandoraea iniqua]|nr:type VI secretion system lipoprotein TssJ [Pandoraea iniqua]
MRRGLSVTGALALFGFSTGCSSFNQMLGGSSEQDALAGLSWSYEQRAIEVSIHADDRLNLADGQAHGLFIRIVQMADPSVFVSHISHPDAIAQLLTRMTLPTGFVAMDSIYVQPGEQRRLSFARAEGAKYVGVVAGYADLTRHDLMRLFRIGVAVKRSGWLVKSRSASPAVLVIDLQLGAQGIDAGEPGAAQRTLLVQPTAGPVPLHTPLDTSVDAGVDVVRE